MAAPRKRRAENFSNQEPKKSIPGPTNIKQFVIMIVLYICRKSLFLDTKYRIGIYLIGTSAGSMIFDVFAAPGSGFSRKDSFLNVYFAKFSWGWTFLLVGTFVFLTSRIYCCGEIKLVIKHLSRLLVGTAFWFFWTTGFQHVENATGMCTSTKFSDKKSCSHGGHKWFGFDTSGHAFLLIHCLLIISEEAKSFQNWDKIPVAIEEETDRPRLTEMQLSSAQISYDDLSIYVKWSVVSLTILTALWDIMLLGTIMYYHSMPQKLLGACFAILTWFVTYQFWYTIPGWSPGLPGQGLLRYHYIK
ncbi:acyl-coenzyme A diphosphatase FITM2-like [Lineus longissimus]|uniref:acyl-coenzyme A diphosphatase FITM2-like n=1 Tax=Lineus longissimus TaxID=88925 RepID=UPI002B4EAA39